MVIVSKIFRKIKEKEGTKNHISSKTIKKKALKELSCRKGLLLHLREKRLRFFLKIKQRKSGIYLYLILVTDLMFRKNEERWKCLILRDMDNYLKFRSV